MNLMSEQQTGVTTRTALNFYIVAASWFWTAFPILTARTPEEVPDNWRDEIGRITNGELLVGAEREVSSDDDDDDDDQQNPTANPQGGTMEVQKRRFDERHRRMLQTREQSNMKKGLSHKQDYFFLGPSAWVLVKEKFGFDGCELRRPCVRTNQARSGSSLAIQLKAEESEGTSPTLINIPGSGRFPYEIVIQKTRNMASTSNVVPEDDDGTNEVRT